MKILCLFQKFSFESSTIYLDLIDCLVERGHEVCVAACTSDRRLSEKKLYPDHGTETVYAEVPDQFHAGKIKKGLIQLMIGRKLYKACLRFWKDSRFDLIIYPTPPITLAPAVKSLKRHFRKAHTFLMLKDIFPQNAVDLHMMKDGGFTHKAFRRMEKDLYAVSDTIGCMSNANIGYVHEMNPEIPREKLCLFPNTVRVLPLPEIRFSNSEKNAVSRSSVNEKPAEKDGEQRPVRITFGGNLGKPQAIDFLMACLERLKENTAVKFDIVGDGTEAARLKGFIEKRGIKNAAYTKELLRPEYEKRLQTSDVGLIILSPYFTIPNFPSRILSYMQVGLPVLAATDRATDIAELILKEARCGWWCPSDDVGAFVDTVSRIINERDKFREYGLNGRKYLENHFTVVHSVEILERAAEGKQA